MSQMIYSFPEPEGNQMIVRVIGFQGGQTLEIASPACLSLTSEERTKEHEKKEGNNMKNSVTQVEQALSETSLGGNSNSTSDNSKDNDGDNSKANDTSSDNKGKDERKGKKKQKPAKKGSKRYKLEQQKKKEEAEKQRKQQQQQQLQHTQSNNNAPTTTDSAHENSTLASTASVLSLDASTERPLLCHLPAKYVKLIWIKKGTYLIVQPLANDKSNRWYEVADILTAEQIKHLKSVNKWPAAFQNSSDKRKHVNNNAESNTDDSTAQKKQSDTGSDNRAYKEESDDENDGGLMRVNNNRRRLVEEESSDDDSDSD